MFERVHRFAKAYPKLFRPGTYARELMDQMEPVVTVLADNWYEQQSHKRKAQHETQGKSKARDGLRATLKVIIDTSSLIERTMPGFADKFKRPRGTSDAALLHTARIFIENIVPLTDVFAKYTAGADLVAELNAGIAGIERHLREREGWRGKKKAATANIEAAIRKGRELTAQLDVVVQNATRGDEFLRGRWKVARHVRQVYRKKKKAAPAKTKGKGAGA